MTDIDHDDERQRQRRRQTDSVIRNRRRGGSSSRAPRSCKQKEKQTQSSGISLIAKVTEPRGGINEAERGSRTAKQNLPSSQEAAASSSVVVVVMVVAVVAAAAGGVGSVAGSRILLVGVGLRVAGRWRRRDVGLLLALLRVRGVALLVAHDRIAERALSKN
jgi:hypothetical protein